VDDQGESGAQSVPVSGMKRGREKAVPAFVAVSACRRVVKGRSGPGRTGQVRVDRLPVLTPKVGARVQRHQTAEVGGSTDAAEIVIAAEAGRPSLVEQTEKDAALAACGR